MSDLPTMLILCGPPGAGKSWMAKALAGPNWTHVNQDTIKHGKPGTREQCVAAARRALQAGQNVIIDRCNMTEDQRSDFVHLASIFGCKLEAAVLATATSVCLQRVEGRVNHEGGVEGRQGMQLVKNFSKNFQLPKSAEGFTRVTMCKSEMEAATAVRYYKSVPCSRPFSAQAQDSTSAHNNATTESTSEPTPDPSQGVFFTRDAALPTPANALSGTDRNIGISSPDPCQPREMEQNRAGPSKELEGKTESVASALLSPQHPLILPPSEAREPKRRKFFPGCDLFKKIVTDPRISSEVEWWDEDLVVMRDKYPKSRLHWLVLPRQAPELEGLTSLSSCHIPILEAMLRKATSWATEHVPVGESTQYGFHAIPSMAHLHLHVMTQDFCGSGMKKKNHWNSFTTDFFLDAKFVIEKVREHGGICVNTSLAESILRTDLICHKCSIPLQNFPTLKAHVNICCHKLKPPRQFESKKED